MYRSTWLFSFALLIGCTADNPNFRPSIQFDAAIGDAHGSADARDMASSVEQPDLTALTDLSRPPPDLFMPECMEGVRFCNDNKIIACDKNKYVVERYCPQGTSCKDASCQAPPQNPAPALSGSSCEDDVGPNENFCLDTLSLNLSCQPFVISNGTGNDNIRWQCATAIGAGTPATPCTNGATCRTGFCGSNGTCYRPCRDDNDCPTGGPVQLTCESVGIVVEGHMLTEKSCIPAT